MEGGTRAPWQWSGLHRRPSGGSKTTQPPHLGRGQIDPSPSSDSTSALGMNEYTRSQSQRFTFILGKCISDLTI